MSSTGIPTARGDDGVRSRPGLQGCLTRKELRETLRDRRTIITLLGMPLLLYPLLGLGFRFLAVSQPSDGPPEYRLAVETEVEANWLRWALNTGDPSRDLGEGGRPEETETPKVLILVPDGSGRFDLQRAVADGDADIGLRIRFDPSRTTSSAAAAEVVILQRSRSPLSHEAADFVRERLAALNSAAVEEWAEELGAEFQLPIRETKQSVPPSSSTEAILGLLPLVLLMMTVTGGVYPAIDLTAGERERETLEALFALPVPRFRLLIAKYVAVVTVTVMTGAVNLLAMTATVFALQLESALFGQSGMTVGLAVKLFLVLMTFALSYSAVLLMLTSATRSFKEAQAYLIPLLLISLVPGLVILLPGWELNYGTSVLPMVNMLLLAKELFEGTAGFLPALAATISTLLYAAAALSLAALVFDRDAVAVGSRGQWGDLMKRPAAVGEVPAPATVFVTLAILFPAYFVASGLLARAAVEAIPTRLVWSAGLTVALFAVLPIAVLVWQRVAWRTGLRLEGTSAWMLAGAALLGLGTWPWVFEIVIWLHSLGIRTFDANRLEQIDELLAAWQAVPLPVVVLCLGVVPGLCEELFFRGFLLSGLLRRLGAFGSIGLTAIAFGFFHIVLSGGAAAERFVPSTLMGLLLGWVAWRSGSVIPSAVLHVVHNSALLTIAHFRDDLAGWSVARLEQEHLPPSVLGGAVLLTVMGMVLVLRGRNTFRSHDSQPVAETAARRELTELRGVPNGEQEGNL